MTVVYIILALLALAFSFGCGALVENHFANKEANDIAEQDFYEYLLALKIDLLMFALEAHREQYDEVWAGGMMEAKMDNIKNIEG